MKKYQLYKTAKIKDSGEIVAINFVGIDYTDSEPCYTIRKCGEYGFGTVIYHLSDLSDFVL